MKLHYRAATFASLAALACATSVNAQGASAETESGSGDIGEIIVTAQKKSDSAQRVPAAISVLSEDRIAKLGVTDLSHISNLTTGLNVETVRTDALVFVRGVGQSVTSPNADSAIALNFNGVYQPSEIAGAAFFDILRLEVLPGPQGTLYGRNSTGGAINLVGRTPGDKLAFDGRVEIGNYARRQVVLGLDAPLGETFAVRLAGTILRHDGYSSNGEDDQRTSALKGAFVWQPGSGTKISGSVIYTHAGGIGSTLENQPPAADWGCGARCANFDPKAQGYFLDADTIQSTWSIEQELSSALTLTYVGGFSHLDLTAFNTQNAGPPLLPLTVDVNLKTHSHELRLNAKTEKLDAIVGLYYFNENSFYANRPANFRSGTYQAGPPPAYSYSVNGFQYNPFDGQSEGVAIFGQASYTLIPGFRLVAGLRYSNTKKSIDGYNSIVSGAGVRTVYLPFSGSNTLNRVDWKAGIEFDLSSNSLFYANASTGFNAGGFSSAPAAAVAPATGFTTNARPFQPTFLQAYTAGLKNKLFHSLATFNAEGFYYDYKNYQVFTRSATGQAYVFTADKATVYGAQVDLGLRPSRNDDLHLGMTFLHAKADRLRVDAAVYDGFDLPYAPKFALNASYERRFDVGSNGAQVRALANFKYTSSRWTTFNHANGSQQSSNTHTDLSLGYYAPDDNWSLVGWIRNLEDSNVKTTCAPSVSTVPGPQIGCTFEAPQTYGVTANFKF